MYIIKIATLNINGMSATTRVGMLSSFINRHALDVVLLQEVTNPDTLNFRGYEIYHNVGTTMRGTAKLVRQTIPIKKVQKIPSGRAISVECSGLKFVKVYAPSESARRNGRENFFNTELPAFLYTDPSHTIIGGDFNCVLSPEYITGPFQTSRALSEIVTRLALVDTWTQDPLRPTYTYHHPTGATRIDRLYVSTDMLQRKSGIEIIPAPFTDHHAVVLRVTLSVPTMRRGLRRWKTDSTVMHDDAPKRKIWENWLQWKGRKRHFPTWRCGGREVPKTNYSVL
jgi:exonuclease III